MKKNTIIYIVLGIAILVGIIGLFVFKNQEALINPSSIQSFEDCVKAGLPVMKSYPRQCRTPDGRTYAEEIVPPIEYKNASADKIIIELPFPGAVVGKSFKVIGKARGTWFFEASFPIEILDKDGKRLAITIATAEGEWMTENFVPFSAEVKIPESYIGPATLVLHKDNPSDMREFDASISFPITIEY